MSPRKKTRTRITPKPKSHSKTSYASTKEYREMRADGTPTEEEFQSWDSYGRFVVTDTDAVSHEVLRGDCVLVLPPDPEQPALSDFWVAKVRGIRSPSSDTANVWLLVQWYYSPADLSGLVKAYASSLPPAPVSFNAYERIFSDHLDIIHHATIDGVVSVTRYEELDRSPSRIGPEAFWTRYDYERGVRCVRPKPLPFPCVGAEEDVLGGKRKLKPETRRCGAYHPCEEMHLCPNVSCMHWWHTRCLSPAPSAFIPEDSPPLPHRKRAHHRKDTTMPFMDSLSIQRVLSSSSNMKRAAFKKELLTGVSSEVLAAAGQPIVRGGRFGIVGNIREVTEARTEVLRALGDPAFAEEEEEEAEVQAEVEVSVKKKQKKTLGLESIGLSAPAVLLTVPSRKKELPRIIWADATVEGAEAYTCPRCGNAI